MKLQEIKISNAGMLKLDILDLPRNCVVIISDGQVKLSELPPYAEMKIVTHQGKVKRVKLDQGEEF